MTGKTLYFAFGSNLLESRMHVNNPNAVRAGIGKLQDYQLDFASYSKIWGGYGATIIPTPGSHIWGALWEIPNEDVVNLDRQEGVQANIYYAITVEVQTPDGKLLNARCYRQVEEVKQINLEKLPEERKPTPAYLNTIIDGALESKLPDEYVEFLRKIPHNGSTVTPNLAYIYPKTFGKVMSSKSYYFAYGSNLLTKRMHRSNPNAVRYGKGVLKNYTLDFGGYSDFWYGSGATIIKKEGQKVWGAIWQLNDEDFGNLDRQEGVHENIYRPIIVQVETPDGKELTCKSYQQVELHENSDVTNLPQQRRPTPAYMNTIINGALETNLPLEYVNFLKTVSTNGIEFAPDLNPETCN